MLYSVLCRLNNNALCVYITSHVSAIHLCTNAWLFLLFGCCEHLCKSMFISQLSILLGICPEEEQTA